MINFPLAAVPFIWKLIFWLWIFVSVLLIFVILIQKGKGGGLSAAFGGGAAQSLLGTKTTDMITKFTIGLVIVFLLLAVLMSKFYRPKLSEDILDTPPAPISTNDQSDTPPADTTDVQNQTDTIPAQESNDQPTPEEDASDTSDAVSNTEPDPSEGQ